MLVTLGSERVIGSFRKGSLITRKLYFIDTEIQLKVLFYLLLPHYGIAPIETRRS